MRVLLLLVYVALASCDDSATEKYVFSREGGYLGHRNIDGYLSPEAARRTVYHLPVSRRTLVARTATGRGISTPALRHAQSDLAAARDVYSSGRARVPVYAPSYRYTPRKDIFVPARRVVLVKTAEPSSELYVRARAPIAHLARAPVAPLARAPVAPLARAPVAPLARAPSTPLQAASVHAAPGYLTTVAYGPEVSGHASGGGHREASSAINRSGKASGKLYAQDKAAAREGASKQRGYEYTYKSGHNWYQPKNVYSYSDVQQIIGYGH
ncbi:PREDICTED: uncharacterized protein LOC106808576 [Priapulus caudatus]|uniref:Uncharacterized protein LOC106808576 n=1 Tax=Priapulus caudatus TaxID=37621 RepID=A0ABM1E3Q3_PRICU|nr:PREDICTED: uncharacterized protein LOC106808576 [Priapulus caudatus]